MKNILILVFSTLTLSSFSQISINIVSPTPLQISDSTLTVQTEINSDNQLTSITAEIGNIKANLGYNPYDGYLDANFLLTSFHEGDTLTLIVTAVDYLNNKQVDSVKFIYANPPVVTYIEPQDNYVASPVLHYKLSIKDFDSCKLDIYATGSVPGPTDILLYSGKIRDSAEGDIDLSGTINHYVYIVITDSKGQKTGRIFYINYITPSTNPLLSLVYKGHKTLLDLYENRVFALDFKGQHPGVIDITNGHETAIPKSGQIYSGHITPEGALFQADNLYNWKPGQVHLVGKRVQDVITKGNYALGRIWNVQGTLNTLWVCDLSTETSEIVDPYGQAVSYDVGSNGLVVYSDYTSRIYVYKSPESKQISHGDGVVTDGNFIAYQQKDNGLHLYLNDGKNELLLSDLSGLHLSGKLLAINNKFVTYCQKGSSGESQVWVRDSLGNNSQVSHFGSSSYPENISPSGQVLFTNGGNRYITLKNGLSKLVSAVIGTTYYYDSSWYMMLGNAVFRINTTIGPVKNIMAGNWSNPAIWSNNRVPDEITAVELDYDVIIDANAQCKSLKTNNHTVHVNQNVALVITGN